MALWILWARSRDLTIVDTSVRKLFLDDYEVETIHDLNRTVHGPTPHPANPVLQPERPWEMGGIHHYGTVLYDEQQELFRFYYNCQASEQDHQGKHVTVDGICYPTNTCLVAYAVSTDGIHWERPILNQVNYEGSTDNNIVRIGQGDVEGVAVFHEPDDPDPARTYKAFYWNQGCAQKCEKEAGGMVIANADVTGGIWVSFSPDGLNWTDYENNPVLGSSDTGHYVVRNPQTKRYLAYGRFIPGKGLTVNGQYVRIIGSAQSENFINWTDFAIAVEADDKEATGPPPMTQIYGMTVDSYEGLFIGGLWVYNFGGGATIDTQLTVSRDGVNWQRVADRQTFLPLGPKGSRSDGMVRPAARFIIRGDVIYILYGMIGGPHQTPDCRHVEREYPPAVGLGILRRDGFVSLDAGCDAGYVLTKAFWLQNYRALHLNVDVQTGGSVRVTVCDWWEGLHPSDHSSDGSLPGFAESEPVFGDHSDTIVRWPERDLSEIAYRRVRLKISLEKASLYSYWFE